MILIYKFTRGAHQRSSLMKIRFDFMVGYDKTMEKDNKGE